MRQKLLIVALSGLASACSVDDVNLVGRPCPCSSGLQCVDGVCVAGGAGGAGGGSGSGGASCTPKTSPSDFKVGWATPNTIRWEWIPGVNPDVQFYEVVTATSEADLSPPTGSAHVWGGSENPELAHYFLDSGNLNPEDKVDFTITDGFDPATHYYALLIAHDGAGCQFVSAPASTFTLDPSQPGDSIELFRDDAPPEAEPVGLALSTVNPFAGSACLAYTQPDPCPAGCYDNFRGKGLSIDLTGKLNANSFSQRAYLEVTASIENGAGSDWSQFWLYIGDYSTNWGRSRLPIRGNRGYRVFQIPLHAMTFNDVEMTLADLESAPIIGYAVGAYITPGATLRYDEVVIKW